MKTLAAILVAAISCTPQPKPSQVEVRRAWPIMGTMLTITVWGTDSVEMLSAVQRGHAAVMLVDSLMSSYRNTSDVARIAESPERPVRVSKETIHVLLHAREYWKLSGGLFDPTVGPLTALWKKAIASGTLPTRRSIDSARTLTGLGHMTIDSARHTVRLGKKGMTLDLGGIAKGYALDLARTEMRRISAGMIDLGGNVLVFGKSPAEDGKWRIGIVHPRDDQKLLGFVTLDSGAVATSGDYENFFVLHGRRYSHVIDVTTGMPSRGVLSASAVAPTGEWSDGMSATLMLMGASAGVRVADSLGTIGAVIVSDPGNGAVMRDDIHLSARAAFLFGCIPDSASSGPPIR